MVSFSTKKLLFFIFILGLFALEACQKDENNTEDIDPYQESYTGVGSSADEYLRADVYTSLKIEIVYEPGAQAEQVAIDSLKSFLTETLNKPNGITITQRAIGDQNQNKLSLQEISEIEDTYRTTYNSSDTLSAFIYFADAEYSEDSRNSKTLGAAYDATSIVIFKKTIQENSGGMNQVSTRIVEESVLKHEFGHLLGLVDFGTPTVSAHEDPDNPHHCNSNQCLMYYATETTASMSNIPLKLDQNCLADLRANGGK